MEFGCRWGNVSSVFTSLREIYEPYNRHRKIIAFDTFTGFPTNMTEHDNPYAISQVMKKGGLACTENYDKYLIENLKLKEEDAPLSHIQKSFVIKGDVTKTLPKYLKEAEGTIIALTFFDLDIYEPTKFCLETILPYLVKGSILVFDELNDHDSPGETVALREFLDGNLMGVEIKRYRYASRVSYIRVE